MKFGGKKGFVKNEAGGGEDGERWIKSFKEGESEVRFLEQMEEWTPYWEHYDQTLGSKGAFFPCTGDRDTCPGCTSENERTRNASKKYLVNAEALAPKADTAYVDLYKITGRLAEDVELKAARDDGDLFRRMYYVIRVGNDKNTTWHADRDDVREPFDPESFRENMQDHEEALQQMWRRAFGDTDPTVDEKPARRSRRVEREEKDTEPEQPARARRTREVPTQREPVEEFVPPMQSEDPPSEPQPAVDQVAEADDEVTLSEEELRAMEPEAIKVLIAQCGFQVIEEDDPNALADYLIRMLGA